MLDNFPHVKTFWIMNTIEISQTALWYGADDIDGTVMDYEITRKSFADTQQRLTQADLLQRIVEAGRQPLERDSLYNIVADTSDPAGGGRITPVITDIAEKVYAGERLALDDARRLYAHHNLAELGMLAHWVRLQKHPEQMVTYNVGRNIKLHQCLLGQVRLLRLLPAAGFQRGLRPAPRADICQNR